MWYFVIHLCIIKVLLTVMLRNAQVLNARLVKIN